MIEEIEIGGYRLLNGFKADLGALTVIIGANATGKSSFIDCLQFISRCCEFTFDRAGGNQLGSGQLLTADGRTSVLEWRLVFAKPSDGHWEDFPLQNDPLVYKAVLGHDKLGRILPKYEVLENLKPAPGYEQPLKFLEATPYRRQIFDRIKHRLIPFDEVEEAQDLFIKEPGVEQADQPEDQLSQSSLRESALLLSQMRFHNEYPVPSAARYMLSSMTFYPGFDVTHSSVLRTKAAEIRPVTWLVPSGENLGTVLHEIFTRHAYRRAAEDFRDYLKSAFPKFEEITCETTFGAQSQILVRLQERDTSRQMEIWELSDGMLRFLCLAAALLNPLPPPLIAIDEPELGLHPGLLPVVADMIKEAAERTQVLITTHSPELLDCFALEDVAVMTRAADEVRSNWHRPASRESLAHMLQEVTSGTLGDLHRSGELEAGA